MNAVMAAPHCQRLVIQLQFGDVAFIDADLFRATDAPDAFLHEEPSYATWTPQIHRAPS